MSKQMHILLVEDNLSDALLIERALETSKLANPIVVKNSGQDALTYLFGDGQSVKPALPPELILLDLHLEDVHGLIVLDHIRTSPQTRLIPVIVLTGSDEQQDEILSKRAGANAYMRKLNSFDQLVTEFNRTIRELGMYWLVLNNAPRH